MEICVVSMQSASLLVYGEGKATKGKIFLLFTGFNIFGVTETKYFVGQHYDALVVGEGDAEVRIFTVGDTTK